MLAGSSSSPWRHSQAVRQRSAKPLFPGPIPGGASMGEEISSPISSADLAHLVERDLAKVEVAGSSPVIRSIFGPVVQLVRTLACHARGQGFESPSGRQSRI